MPYTSGREYRMLLVKFMKLPLQALATVTKPKKQIVSKGKGPNSPDARAPPKSERVMRKGTSRRGLQVVPPQQLQQPCSSSRAGDDPVSASEAGCRGMLHRPQA